MKNKKLTEDLKFKYVNTELTEKEISQMTKEEWEGLYLYMVQRDKPYKKGFFPTLTKIFKDG